MKVSVSASMVVGDGSDGCSTAAMSRGACTVDSWVSFISDL